MDTKLQISENYTEVQIHLYDNGISIKSRGVWDNGTDPWSEGVTLTANGLSHEGILAFVKYAESMIGVPMFEQVHNILS